jgi:hypothetical protein
MTRLKIYNRGFKAGIATAALVLLALAALFRALSTYFP